MRKKNRATPILGLLACVLIICPSACSSAVIPPGPASSVVIEKGARKLHLLSGGRIIKTYTIALGTNPTGPKQVEGDGKTPEGKYIIDGRNPNSAFHKSLHISYPSELDVLRARALGKPPGGDIMIHGIKNGLGWVGRLHTASDWTQGCIAVTDDDIEEIWASVPDGTPVEITP